MLSPSANFGLTLPKQAASIAGNTAATASYTQVIASTTYTSAGFCVINTSGSVIKVAVGGSGSEVDIPFYIPSSTLPIFVPKAIPKGSRISVRSVDTNGTTGVVVVNLLG